MKKQTRFHFLLPVLLILLLLISLPVSAEKTSGDCGDNAHWTLSDSGVLTISGTGLVTDKSWSPLYKSIIHIVIEDGITNVPGWAFQGYSNLTTVKMADSVTIIGQYAFERCTGLTSIDLPQNLEIIEKSAFSHCSSLQKVTMGNKVTTIGDFVFSGTSITEITLSNSLTSLGVSVFNRCENLTEIHFPPSLKKMGEYVFNYCPKLEAVYFHGDLPDVPNFKYSDTHCMIYHHPDNKTWAKENHPICSGSIRILAYATSTSCGDQHTYGDWVVTVEPTAYVDVGWKERVCTRCGYTQSVAIPVDEDIPMLPDTSEPATSPTTTPTVTVPATQPPTTTPPVTVPSTQPATESNTPPTTESTSTPATEPDTSQTTQPNTSQPATSAPTSSDSIPSPTADNAEKSDPTVLIACIVLSVVLIGGVAVWYFLRKK